MQSILRLPWTAPKEKKRREQARKEQEEEIVHLDRKNEGQEVQQNNTLQEPRQTATKPPSRHLSLNKSWHVVNLTPSKRRIREAETRVLDGRKNERDAKWTTQDISGGDAPDNEPIVSVSNPTTNASTVIVNGMAIPLPDTVQEPKIPDLNHPAPTESWRKVFVAISRAQLLIFFAIAGAWLSPLNSDPGDILATKFNQIVIDMLSHFPEPFLKLILALVNQQSGYTIIATLFVTSVFGSFALYTLGCLFLTLVHDPLASFRYLRLKYEQIMIRGLRVKDALDAHYERCIEDEEYRTQWLTRSMTGFPIMEMVVVLLASIIVQVAIHVRRWKNIGVSEIGLGKE
ncbi:hypothetical protein E6O75_ATG04584 [Venturia nashicola]|uniref:Uncharacterized protein n=1 Tax=Venturia nashicola TaxID=86259 RepID=A0A4Z1PDK2_9PEZI|nr:hypothetical protein E6O75_ATG04584 [Venturia nashicola]